MILLSTKVGPFLWQHTTMVNYYVLNSLSAYNIILGRDWLTPTKAMCSTCHFLVKFLMLYGVTEVKGDQQA